MNEVTLNEGYKIWIKREVLFRDLDALGHMNNVAMMMYFEDARVEYFKRLDENRKTSNWGFILARVECDYIDQVQFGQKLIVAIKSTLIGRKSLTLEYVVSELETSLIVARGKSVSVFFDYDSNKAFEVPADVIAKIEAMEERKFERRL